MICCCPHDLSLHHQVFALGAAVACVILCELYKFQMKGNIQRWKDDLRRQQEDEEAERLYGEFLLFLPPPASHKRDTVGVG